MSFDGRDNTKNLSRFISIVIPSKKEFGLIFLSFIYKVVGIYNSDDIVKILVTIFTIKITVIIVMIILKVVLIISIIVIVTI